MRNALLQDSPEKLLRKLKVPAFPPIAIRVLQLVSDEDVNISDVLDLLKVDPAFSAEILQRANSPLYGFRSQITTLQHALVILGLEQIKTVSLTVATRMYLKVALKVDELRRCWRHTVACALIADECAAAFGVRREEAYTAGLMHDIGVLGLLAAKPNEYAELLRDLNAKAADGYSVDLMGAERASFGLDHCQAGKHLTQSWKLPPDFGSVAGNHHQPFSAAEPGLLSLVKLSTRLADSLGFSIVKDPSPPSVEEALEGLPGEVRERLGSNLDQFRERIEKHINSFDLENFKVPLPRASGASLIQEECAGVPPEPAPAPWRFSRPHVLLAGLAATLGLLAIASRWM